MKNNYIRYLVAIFFSCSVLVDTLQGLNEETLKPYMFMGTEIIYTNLLHEEAMKVRNKGKGFVIGTF